VAAQGIIHGGIKYSLGGLVSDSTRAIREMPEVWRQCLAGRIEPDLSSTPVLSEHCHLWRTSSIKSKLGMVGAKIGLRSQVSGLASSERPAVLRGCPGEVLLVDEQVIDTVGFLRTMADRNRDCLIKVDEDDGVVRSDETGACLRLCNRESNLDLSVRAETVVLSAGSGNAALRRLFSLSPDAMQRRPLHMVLVRGELPRLYGHCTDGAATRVTITTTCDRQGRAVWQVGGKVSEEGVAMESAELIRHARRELESVLPGARFENVEWTTYRIDRAEQRSTDGSRPDGPYASREGNILTAWPTKLALVPQLVTLIVQQLSASPGIGSGAISKEPDWPRPEIALPPWEANREWSILPPG
jgi:glycerol-3-phosphate dehydrogenase